MATAPKRTYVDPSEIKDDVRESLEGPIATINEFIRDTVDCLDRGLDYNNLNQAVVTLSVRVDSTGKPIIGGSFKNPLKGKRVQGLQVIRAVNTTSPATYPTSQPFISFIENENGITVRNITSLPINNTFDLTVLVL